MTIKKKLIDRKDELLYLEKEYKKRAFTFISIIGRRRVGKTRLIEEFVLKKNRVLYFLVQELDDKELRLSFAERAHNVFKINFLGIPSWELILEEIFKIAQRERIIVILDEFQRFALINTAVPSLLQGVIDKYAKNSKLFLIVMGSSIGMMHKLFDYSSALYGRRTGQLFVQPLRPFFLKEWFLELPLEKVIEIYSIFGGTPKYLEDVNPRMAIIENIQESILSKRSILYNEPEILIKTELPNSSTYFNILKLISEGKTKPNEIAGSLTIKETSMSYFLHVLEKDMELIKRVLPVTETKQRSKKVLYKMNDNFFRFWFRYVFPYKSDIELNTINTLVEKIKNELNSFIGQSFEDVCKDVLIMLNNKDSLPFTFSKIGTWWGFYRDDNIRKELEIDIVALNNQTKEILFVECKWQDNVDAKKILNELKEKAGFVQWNNGRRKEYYAIFAKTFREKIKDQNTLLFDIRKLELHKYKYKETK